MRNCQPGQVLAKAKHNASVSSARWDITLTDGGIETRIIYEFKRQIGDFEALHRRFGEGCDQQDGVIVPGQKMLQF